MTRAPPAPPLPPRSLKNATLVFVSGYQISSSHGHDKHLDQQSWATLWTACMGRAIEEAWQRLQAQDADVRTLRLADVPAAALLRRQWKKLAGIIAGARVAEYVLWHDGDAVPHPAADLITRCRLIAAEQPTVNVWMGPGDPEFHGLPFMRDEHFYGATVRSTFKQHYPLHPAISLHTGIILVRASAVNATIGAVLDRFYNAEAADKGEIALTKYMMVNASLPGRYAATGCGEQGALTYHLVNHYSDTVRIVPWLGRDWLRNTCMLKYLYPIRLPSFVHFSGCRAGEVANSGENRSRWHASAVGQLQRCVRILCPYEHLNGTSSSKTSMTHADPSKSWDEQVIARWSAYYGRVSTSGASTLLMRDEMPNFTTWQGDQRANPNKRDPPYWSKVSDIALLTNVPLKLTEHLTNESLRRRRKALADATPDGQPVWRCKVVHAWDRSDGRKTIDADQECECGFLRPDYLSRTLST